MRRFAKFAVVALAAGVLLGCGGGGSGGGAVSQGPDGSGTGSQLPAATLSENQRLFEETALSGNGGAYSAYALWGWSAAWPSFTGLAYFTFELPSSPAGVAGGVSGTETPEVDLLMTEPVDPKFSDDNPNAGVNVLVDGRILFYPYAGTSRVAYQGDDIRKDRLTPSGLVAGSQLITSHVKVPLIGRLADAPEELLRLYAFDPSRVDMAASFASGSAYYRQTARWLGDQVFITDWDGDPDVDPKTATPIATGIALEAFMANGSSQNLENGTFRTVNGARCWVSNAFSSLTLRHAIYCQVGGDVYNGSFAPDGTPVIATYYPSAASPAKFQSDPITYRLNETAFNSLKAMFH